MLETLLFAWSVGKLQSGLPSRRIFEEGVVPLCVFDVSGYNTIFLAVGSSQGGNFILEGTCFFRYV